VPAAVARLGEALETDDPAARIEELARLGGFERLRDFDVPEGDLPSLAEEVAARPGARANPRPVTAADAEALLRSIW
jgi:alcohol dehydrogenase class IV